MDDLSDLGTPRKQCIPVVSLLKDGRHSKYIHGCFLEYLVSCMDAACTHLETIAPWAMGYRCSTLTDLGFWLNVSHDSIKLPDRPCAVYLRRAADVLAASLTQSTQSASLRPQYIRIGYCSRQMHFR